MIEEDGSSTERADEDALGVAGARPELGDLAHAVAKARAAAALFGSEPAVTVGRYRVLSRLGGGGGGEVWSAWDPELDRRVALKLIATASSRELRERVRAEGQALARLSHPNVVPVHDVIDHGEHVVLVMEHVDGGSLRAWTEGRRAREVVHAYRQLAEGLAAMHAAGLVHRDVKPDNAMVGVDGRVRVVDLGLALAADVATGVDGRVAGTPGYMAPEQLAGQMITPAVDQYGLCASLRETLTRDGGGVPPWLEQALERGTAPEPAARFPSMVALAAALAADPARRRRRLAAVAAGLGAVGLAFVLGRSAGATGTRAPACDGGVAVARAWGEARRAHVRAHLAAQTSTYAGAAGPALIAALDGYATGWRALFDQACRARAAGEISPTLAERRAGCLASAHAALDTVAELTATAEAADLPDLIQATASLPSLEHCADDAALLAEVAPPPAAIAAPAAALAERLALIQVHVDAARPAATTMAADALAQARTLGHSPLLARALVLDGRARRHDPDHGASRFADAVTVALAARDDALAVEAFARHVWAAATSGATTEVPGGVAVVESLAARTAGADFARALLDNNLGVAALARGDREAARRAFDAGLARAGALTGAAAAELLVLYANLALVTDDDRARARLLGELLARRTALLGPAHPRTLDVRIMQGMLAPDVGTAGRLLDAACADLARYHPGAGSDLADCWFERALVAELSGELETARVALARAIATEGVGGDPVRVALARAHAQRLAGQAAAARAAFTALIEAQRDPGDRWWLGVQRAEARLGRALVLRTLGDRAAALADAGGAADELEGIDARQRLAWIARRARLARGLVTELRNPLGSPR